MFPSSGLYFYTYGDMHSIHFNITYYRQFQNYKHPSKTKYI